MATVELGGTARVPIAKARALFLPPEPEDKDELSWKRWSAMMLMVVCICLLLHSALSWRSLALEQEKRIEVLRLMLDVCSEHQCPVRPCKQFKQDPLSRNPRRTRA